MARVTMATACDSCKNLHSFPGSCLGPTASKRRRRRLLSETAAKQSNAKGKGDHRLSRIIVGSILLLSCQQQPNSASALFLLPLPGRSLVSSLLSRSQNSNHNRKRMLQISEDYQNDADAADTSETINAYLNKTVGSPTTTIQIQTPSSASSPPSTSRENESSLGTEAKTDWSGTSTQLVNPPVGTITVRKKPATSERDRLISEAAKLRQSIVQQQNELITLERRIECCTADGKESPVTSNSNIVISGISYSLYSSASIATNLASGLVRTFQASSRVFLRKIDRVQKRVGPNNQQWEGRVGAYLFYEFLSGLRIASKLAKEPRQIQQLVSDPRTPTLVPHAPAILARLDRLETHVRPIIESVLNDRQHLASIEPYLDEILERFDDIEPHLPWILDNIDALAPYTGLLLKHIDALLLFAQGDEWEESNSNSSYSLANQLLPYLEYYVSKLDVIGPHLVLLRPHVPLLLKHNRIAKVSPHIEKLFARGYGTRLAASANMDVLLFWFGWTLRIPFLPGIFFALPWSPTIVDFLANRLPKKFARKGKAYCRNLECAIDDDYGGAWNQLEKE